MQKRKFDELISHFNRKVSDMSIDKKYKMELLGMISAIGFAHEKELGTNLAEVGTDAISRQAAIRWVKTECNPYGKPTLDFESGKKVIEHLKQMPSAQPEIIRCKDCKHYRHGLCMKASMCVNKSENGFCDWAERGDNMRLIDADALQLAIVEEGQANKRKKYSIGDIWELTGEEIREVINSQPTIQPEPLTDKEQRIFLAAMERERKVCKEVDDQYVHEPYEILLTKVCSEIERKVKKALWS